jgi:hypothetical protein
MMATLGGWEGEEFSVWEQGDGGFWWGKKGR